MMDPTTMSPGSIMPAYEFMIEQNLDTSTTAAKIRAMITLGVPYESNYDLSANKDLMKQANKISENLKKDGIKVDALKEIVAITAYLQRLGTDIKGNKTTSDFNK